MSRFDELNEICNKMIECSTADHTKAFGRLLKEFSNALNRWWIAESERGVDPKTLLNIYIKTTSACHIDISARAASKLSDDPRLMVSLLQHIIAGTVDVTYHLVNVLVSEDDE